MILSVAFSKSSNDTELPFLLAATIAASLHMLAISAPANPGVYSIQKEYAFHEGEQEL